MGDMANEWNNGEKPQNAAHTVDTTRSAGYHLDCYGHLSNNVTTTVTGTSVLPAS